MCQEGKYFGSLIAICWDGRDLSKIVNNFASSSNQVSSGHCCNCGLSRKRYTTNRLKTSKCLRSYCEKDDLFQFQKHLLAFWVITKRKKKSKTAPSWTAGNENKRQTTQKLQTLRAQAGENTKQHADGWEWSQPVTKKQHKKKILYMHGARPDATSQTLLPVFPTQLKSHKIWNKRRQSSDCSRLNGWHRVHGQNCANIHLFRVSGTETGREGKQWLNVFVSVSQKLIAAYLHSRDHTRCSMLNGGEEEKTCVVIKDIVIEGSGSVSESQEIL